MDGVVICRGTMSWECSALYGRSARGDELEALAAAGDSVLEAVEGKVGAEEAVGHAEVVDRALGAAGVALVQRPAQAAVGRLAHAAQARREVQEAHVDAQGGTPDVHAVDLEDVALELQCERRAHLVPVRGVHPVGNPALPQSEAVW